MSKYPMVRLEDVCDKATSSIAQKDLKNLEGIYPIYGAGGFIKNVNFYKQDREYIAIVKDGAGIGRAMILPAFSSVIGTMQYILPKDNIITKYLYFAIDSMNLAKYFTGATIPHIYFKDYKNESLPLPPIEHQRSIIKILESIVSLIIKRKQQLSKFDELAKSRFIEMFGDFPLNEKKWETGQIRNVVYDVRYGTSLPASLDGKYPYFRMNNITYSGELDLSEIKRINIPDREFSKYAIQKGDVLFNRTNSKELVGKTCVYDKDDKMILAGFIIRIRVNDRMLAEFLSAFLNADFSKKMLLEKCKTAIGQANINAQELQNFDIYIPPIELQKQFVFIKNQLDKSKFRMKKCLNLFSYMRHLRIIGI